MEQQTTAKQSTTTSPQNATPGAASATGEFSAGDAQRAMLHPDKLLPDDLIALQRAVGNQTVQRMIASARPQVQREAEQASVGLEGGTAPADVAAELRRSHGGRPLQGPLRTQMEQGIGSDFGQVRLHMDGTADRLNRTLNAKAFTHGKDIYFKRGAYQPGSADGKRLLAHELTHVVQQTGRAPIQRNAIQRRFTPRAGTPSPFAKSLTAAPPAHVVRAFTPTPAPSREARIQRLVTRANFEKLAGRPSRIARLRRSTYVQLLNALSQYEQAETAEMKQAILNDVVRLAEEWLSNHGLYTKQTDQAGNPYFEGRPFEDKDLRKDMFMHALISEAKAELNNKPLVKDTPSRYIADYDATSDTSKALESGLSELGSEQKYKFSFLAWVEHQDYLDFAKERAKLSARNRVPLLRKTKLSNKEIKSNAAKNVVNTKYSGLNDDAREKKIKELRSIGSQVGHAWLKFATFDDTGKQLKEDSFGFWPLKHFPHPRQAVPGRIEYPDTLHDNDSRVRRKDINITAEQYLRGMSRVTQLMKSPPLYKLVDYNCTKFVMEIAQAVGVPFPSGARVGFPVHALVPFKIHTWDPNSLYRLMEGDESSYNPAEAEAEKLRAEQEAAELELASYEQVRIRYSTTPYIVIGQEDQGTRSYRRADGDVWIVKPEQQDEFYDPFSGDVKPALMVKLKHYGVLVSAWMHTDALRA